MYKKSFNNIKKDYEDKNSKIEEVNVKYGKLEVVLRNKVEEVEKPKQKIELLKKIGDILKTENIELKRKLEERGIEEKEVKEKEDEDTVSMVEGGPSDGFP